MDQNFIDIKKNSQLNTSVLDQTLFYVGNKRIEVCLAIKDHELTNSIKVNQ